MILFRPRPRYLEGRHAAGGSYVRVGAARTVSSNARRHQDSAASFGAGFDERMSAFEVLDVDCRPRETLLRRGIARCDIDFDHAGGDRVLFVPHRACVAMFCAF